MFSGKAKALGKKNDFIYFIFLSYEILVMLFLYFSNILIFKKMLFRTTVQGPSHTTSLKTLIKGTYALTDLSQV